MSFDYVLTLTDDQRAELLDALDEHSKIRKVVDGAQRVRHLAAGLDADGTLSHIEYELLEADEIVARRLVDIALDVARSGRRYAAGEFRSLDTLETVPADFVATVQHRVLWGVANLSLDRLTNVAGREMSWRDAKRKVQARAERKVRS